MRSHRFLKKTFNFWTDFLSSPDLSRTLPWWEMMGICGSNSSFGVQVPSLTMLTYYYPSRIRRQIGCRQVIPADDCKVQVNKVLNSSLLKIWVRYWRERPTMLCKEVPESCWITRSYRSWMCARDAESRQRAREAELSERIHC